MNQSPYDILCGPHKANSDDVLMSICWFPSGFWQCMSKFWFFNHPHWNLLVINLLIIWQIWRFQWARRSGTKSSVEPFQSVGGFALNLPRWEPIFKRCPLQQCHSQLLYVNYQVPEENFWYFWHYILSCLKARLLNVIDYSRAKGPMVHWQWWLIAEQSWSKCSEMILSLL